jgi:salicylate hydroxylase
MLIRHIDVPYKWALMGREPMANWVNGRVTLLGDACHPTLPFMAQGAQMAMEDGVILARCLAQYSDIDEALQHYQDARRERTARVVRASTDNATRFHNPALAQADTAAEYVDREWQPHKVSDRYDWLFTYDAMTTPV